LIHFYKRFQKIYHGKCDSIIGFWTTASALNLDGTEGR